MPLYEFRCENAHLSELTLPISGRDRAAACPRCGSPVQRLISSPRLSRLGSSEARLIDRTEASAHAPGVIDRVPATGARASSRSTSDPRHAKLPHP